QSGYFACPAKGGTNSLVFVRRDGHPIGTSADQYACTFYLALYGLCNRVGEVGVVDRLAIVGAEIGDGISEFFDIVFYDLFVFESGMIGADCNFSGGFHVDLYYELKNSFSFFSFFFSTFSDMIILISYK